MSKAEGVFHSVVMPALRVFQNGAPLKLSKYFKDRVKAARVAVGGGGGGGGGGGERVRADVQPADDEHSAAREVGAARGELLCGGGVGGQQREQRGAPILGVGARHRAAERGARQAEAERLADVRPRARVEGERDVPAKYGRRGGQRKVSSRKG